MSSGSRRRKILHFKETVKPTDLKALKSQVRNKRINLSKAKRNNHTLFSIVSSRIALVVAQLALFKPLRVWNYYGSKLGQVIAAGLSFLLFFSVVALVFIGLTAAGLILRNKPEVLSSLIVLINDSAPRLLTTDTEGGLIDPTHLLKPEALFSVGIVSFGILLFSALGWLGATRNGIRTIFGVGSEKGNILILKLRDGVALIFLGITMLLSVVVAFSMTQTLKTITQWLHIENEIATELIRYAGLLLVYILDVAVSFIIFRIVSGIKMLRRIMWLTSMLTAFGLSILRILGTAILGASTRYPEFAVYAVPLGLLIWFNFINQIYLVGAAWGAVSTADQEQKTMRELGRRGRYYEEITGEKRIFS